MSAGIDYGLGRTNIDYATGIRYGVIAQNSVLQAWADSAEADYGPPTCPKCGNDACEFDLDKHGEYDNASGYLTKVSDYACEACEVTIASEDAYGDEPVGWHYSGDGYELTDCLDSTIFVLKSPFYTLAVYCSPCVPGAGDLDNASEDGVKTYCLGHDWFEEGKAPYTVFSVETNLPVLP